MNVRFQYSKNTFEFKFEAGTSRGVLTHRDSWFIKISSLEQPNVYGLGEASPLPGLSIDSISDLENILQYYALQKSISILELKTKLSDPSLYQLPSFKFALETALLDLESGGRKIIFSNDFTLGKRGISINGLVWMGSKDSMLTQVQDKINQGYQCIKLKVGAIDFEEEFNLLKYIRSRYSAEQITLRLDANGAWTKDEAIEKLNRLSALNIHSIEQPIKPNQRLNLKQLCTQSPIKIALDEELIGFKTKEEKENLLSETSPSYIILKPGLLGGFSACNDWIDIAKQYKIDWWITSALESNIGLNAICQYTATKITNDFPQGLGTGQLYVNNIDSPLDIRNGYIFYNQTKRWKEETLNFS